MDIICSNVTAQNKFLSMRTFQAVLIYNLACIYSLSRTGTNLFSQLLLDCLHFSLLAHSQCVQDFTAGKCTTCDVKHLCIPMGYHSRNLYRELQERGLVQSKSHISLYSLTGSSRPYCSEYFLSNSLSFIKIGSVIK